MANPEHLTLLQGGGWNNWRLKNANTIPELSGANLSGAVLREADLSTADLSRAILSGADLVAANLSGAILRDADLGGADLSDAKLRQANLSRADLSGAELRQASLSRADLGGAKLRQAKLSGANLSGAELSRAKLSLADLRVADLSGAILTGAILSGADLSGADLSRAILSGADLSRANLSGAILSEAILIESDLNKAVLSRAYLDETAFGNTNMRDTEGLAECSFYGPCTLDHRTIQRSGKLPLPFLIGCGLPDSLIEYLPSLLNEAIQFFSCFISYSHKDKPFARRLHDTLQGRGVRCWLDEKQLLPGDDIYEHVDRGIRFWDKILLCCSEASLTSWWVDNEIGTAFEKEQQLTKERGKKVQAIIPLNLDGYIFEDGWKSGYRAQIRRRLAADFRGWNGKHETFESAVEQVILALRADEGARPPVPPQRL